MRITKLLNDIFTLSNDDAQDYCADLLDAHGYFPERGALYTFGQGTIPLMLIAHTDTVHRAPPKQLFCDASKHVVFAPGGLGADDRAGVYAIARILQSGLRPHVLFPDQEETGGHGATEAAHDLRQTIANLDVRALLELDRKGSSDAVTYDCHCPPLLKFLKPYGFKHAHGSFTDINILMKEWSLAGANLSVGYYNQHTSGEYLRLDELEHTIRQVSSMLRSPPARRIHYAPLPAPKQAPRGQSNSYPHSALRTPWEWEDEYAQHLRRDRDREQALAHWRETTLDSIVRDEDTDPDDTVTEEQ